MKNASNCLVIIWCILQHHTRELANIFLFFGVLCVTQVALYNRLFNSTGWSLPWATCTSAKKSKKNLFWPEIVSFKSLTFTKESGLAITFQSAFYLRKTVHRPLKVPHNIKKIFGGVCMPFFERSWQWNVIFPTI